MNESTQQMIEAKIVDVTRQILSATIDAKAAKLAENQNMADNAAKTIAMLLKLKSAFEQLIKDKTEFNVE